MDVAHFAVLGLGTGAVFALVALAITVVHRGSGVLNFASGAIGMCGAYVHYELTAVDGPNVAWQVAMPLGMATAAVIGAAMHLVVMRRLSSAPVVSKIVATLGLMTLLTQAVSMTWAEGGASRSVPSILPTSMVELTDDITVGADRLLLLALACGLTLALVVLQRYTRVGLATSAVAENPLVASSMGWSPNTIGAIAWALGGAIAAMAAILGAPLAGLSVNSLTFLVVPGLAAALVGRFDSFVLTLAGALLIGIAESEVGRYVTSPGWATAAPLLGIVVGLALRGRVLPERSVGFERRPLVGSGRIGRPAVVALVVGGVAVMSASSSWLDALTTTLGVAMVLLSIVVLTGYAGQLSLAQFGLAGMGAYLTAVLTVEHGWPLLVATVVGPLLCVPLGFAVALPALRARGNTLAVATLSLAVAIDALVLSNPARAGTVAGKPLGALRVFGLNLDGVAHPKSFAIASLVVVAVVGLAIANLRRGPAGRRIIAVRSNERAAAALGVSVVGVKLYAFGLAAFIAALGGALIEVRFRSAQFHSFQLMNSITAVLQAVIGGVGWIAGAVLGALMAPGSIAARAIEGASIDPEWLLLVSGAGVLAMVLQSPDGLAQRQRDDLAKLWAKIRRGSGGCPVGGSPDELERVRPHRVAPTALEARGVTIRFGGQVALNDVAITVRPGEVVGLIGPNGAGKSTLIDVLTGFQPCRGSEVLLNGRPIGGLRPAQRARAGVSRTFQSLELFDDMTVLENLRSASDGCSSRRYLTDLVWPRLPELTPAARAAIQELRLHDVLHRRPDELDYPMRRLVALARALSSEPSILLLDEPAAGVDEAERAELSNVIDRVAREWGVGVLLVEHDVNFVFGLSDRVVVLDGGTVIADGSVEQVEADPVVVAAYLGEPVRSGGLRESEAVS